MAGGRPANTILFPDEGHFTVGFLSCYRYQPDEVNRRAFLVRTATGGAIAYGFPDRARATAGVNLVDEVGYSVIDFLDDEWDVATFESELSDAVNVTCHAYGKVSTANAATPEQDPGYLARLRDLVWNRLQDNPEAYDWLLDYIDKIARFVGSLDVFSDRIAAKMNEVAEMAAGARRVTKFIPLVWSVKGVLDSGCLIHDKLDSDVAVSMDTYIRFFKRVALVIVEVLLLAAGVGVAYKAAFRATGGVNSMLINVVGRRIGWKAYSWVLSLVHWGIRVIFAEGMGEAIGGSIEAVTGELVEESPLNRSEGESMAEEDVHTIAEHSDGWLDRDYAIWKQKREARQLVEDAERRAEEVADWLPFT